MAVPESMGFVLVSWLDSGTGGMQSGTYTSIVARQECTSRIYALLILTTVEQSYNLIVVCIGEWTPRKVGSITLFDDEMKKCRSENSGYMREESGNVPDRSAP